MAKFEFTIQDALLPIPNSVSYRITTCDFSDILFLSQYNMTFFFLISLGQEDPLGREMTSLSSTFLLGKPLGQRSLEDYSPLGGKSQICCSDKTMIISFNYISILPACDWSL